MKSLLFPVAALVSLSVACGGAPPSPPATATSAPSVGPDTAAPPGGPQSAPEAHGDTSAPPVAPPKEPEITSVRVVVSNGCDTKVDYCVEDGASTLNTSLTQRTTTTHSVKPGAKLRLKKGGSCGDTLFTVPAEKGEVKASICSK